MLVAASGFASFDYYGPDPPGCSYSVDTNFSAYCSAWGLDDQNSIYGEISAASDSGGYCPGTYGTAQSQSSPSYVSAFSTLFWTGLPGSYSDWEETFDQNGNYATDGGGMFKYEGGVGPVCGSF
jgi:hypothetical protein